MKIKFSEIEDAFFFASAGGYGEHTALLDKKAGKIYFHSEYGDFDEIPEEAWESEDTVEIPHKNDLDLGQRLVFRFVDEVMPDDCDTVRKIFSRRSAYAYYKDLLEEKDMLDRWYAFEGTVTKETLREWCSDNGIELAECEN